MLSQPLDAHRWPKVFQRLVRLYEAYPLDVKCQFPVKEFHLENVPKELVKEAYDYQAKHGFVGFGWDVITTYLKQDTSVPENIKKPFYPEEGLAPIQYLVVSGSLQAQTEAFVKHLHHKDIAVRNSDNP